VLISEPWEWLHEASSRVADRIYICNRKKNREDKISLFLRADLSPAHFHFQTLFILSFKIDLNIEQNNVCTKRFILRKPDSFFRNHIDLYAIAI
jgi:hypothetical protein